jgi:hypothetical protein
MDNMTLGEILIIITNTIIILIALFGSYVSFKSVKLANKSIGIAADTLELNHSNLKLLRDQLNDSSLPVLKSHVEDIFLHYDSDNHEFYQTKPAKIVLFNIGKGVATKVRIHIELFIIGEKRMSITYLEEWGISPGGSIEISNEELIKEFRKLANRR